jgi:hypothetical protein
MPTPEMVQPFKDRARARLDRMMGGQWVFLEGFSVGMEQNGVP